MPTRRTHSNTRRGVMMLELAVAVVLVATLLASSMQVLRWTAQQRRAVDRRAAALVEAGNVLDQLTSLSWDDTTAERLQAVTLSAEAAALLPQAKLDIALKEADGEPPGKRLTVTLDWQDDHGQRTGPVRLTAWKFAEAPHE